MIEASSSSSTSSRFYKGHEALTLFTHNGPVVIKIPVSGVKVEGKSPKSFQR